MLPSGLSILDSGRSKLSPGFSKIQTRFLCDLQPYFNSSDAQNTSWIIYDSQNMCCYHPQHRQGLLQKHWQHQQEDACPSQAFGVRISSMKTSVL